MVMGNVNGRKENLEEFDQEEFYMEDSHGHGLAQVSSSSYHAHMVQSPPPHNSPRAYQFPLMFTPQIPVAQLHSPNQIMQMQRVKSNETSTHNQSAITDRGMSAVISWVHEGTQVAIEGSWDNWRTRDLLEGTGREFSIIKVLKAGVYHYRFIVDGQWTYAPDLPHECDNMGNVFNILNLKETYPEHLNTGPESECPSSPVSSYNNAPFTLEDYHEKLPELPPLLQHMPLTQPSSSKDCPESIQKPLTSNLNHLYVHRGLSNQPTIALSSTQRFRSKFVTTVLYKSVKKVKK